ncbi:uncharacterized protein LOC110446354 [Mizuhopecten yessoensis]|uniref:uncharacterized protein LOC110446354 n=1 Tax=Mizuhopecten yessoensis TaxID=6573 RepID=UPI000B457205|nr:uncharacterized protein LOC110446354 [Mizuhopecten yessoensis]
MMNASYLLLATLVVSAMHTVQAEYNPNVTVTSCSSTAVVIHIQHARDGGIIYIQERGPECKLVTSALSRDYIFNFDLCNISLDTMFRVIVQERPNIQTGSDKVVPVMCIVDLGEIMVGNVIMPHSGESSHGINKTTKPVARMRIISDRSNDVSQGTVILSDELRMEVSLDKEYRDDFEISATDCSASEMDIIKDRCSADDELFPDFVRDSNGSLVSKFKAFIPTDYEGRESVEMSYSCTLVVCQGGCEPTVCREVVGWGKKKRRKRSSPEKDVDKITCGTTIRVISPHAKNAELNQADTTDENVNINKNIMYVVAGLGCLTLVTAWFLSCYLYQRLLTAKGETSKVSVARAVGRRLSAMLNIPSGYELNNQKMMHFLPEEEGTTERRKSVTTMHIGKLDSSAY